MASIDERVVAMSFENTTFEAKVAQTQATLVKLNQTIATIGAVNGLENIEKAANKVTLTGPMTALDKLKAKLGLASQGAPEAFGEIDRAGNKVTLEGPSTALDKLRAKIAGVGSNAADGFNEIERASGKVALAPLSSAIDSVQAKFSGLTIAATAAFGTIVSQATIKGKELVNALTLGPITGGLQEYATNLNSIQTILANTEASGADLQDVNKALQELNRYSDQTIYNFSQMAKNIGTFTAAGVDLDTATQSIKGIANLAALSGSNSEQASTAMYQLSQAISAGRVSLQDWNSVVNAGMGGTVFQRALATTAENMGTLSKGAVELKGKMKNVTIEGQSFRESITAKPGEQSWLTSEVLTNTLKQFTGDLSAADLAAQGFNDQQIKAIMKTAETARHAATEVKTLKGVFDVAQESIGSGWASTFQIIFGNFEEAKKTFTDLSNAIQGVIGNAANARNKILEGWKELGGRKELIDGIKAAFEALMSFLKPIGQAFRDIFPRKTAQDLFEMTVHFREFMEQAKLAPETMEGLKRTFRGLFALLHIGIEIIKGVIGVIADLLGFAGKGAGGFLNFTGSIGDFIVAIDKAISSGEDLQGVFAGIAAALTQPIKLIQDLASAITTLFTGGEAEKGNQVAEAFSNIEKSSGPLATVIRNLAEVWEKFFGVLQDVYDFLEPVLNAFRDVFSQVGDAIRQGLDEVNFEDILNVIQTVFIGGLAVGVKKLLGGIGLDLTGGTLDKLKSSLTVLSSTLVTIQQNVKAQTLLLIAAAVVALAGAAIIFSQIDPAKLAKAMTAISVGIGQLVGAMALLTKFGGGFVQLPVIAASMLILAGAIDVLAIAVFAFSKLSWEELARGLAGVAGALAAIAAGTKLMAGPQLLLIGPALLVISGALVVMSLAMKVFASMKWEEIAKGLAAVAGLLVAIGLASKAIGPQLLLIGPGLILAGVGLTILSGAVSAFGNMKLETIAKGIAGIAASLIVIGIAIAAIPPTIALQAAGLVILSIALTGVATAVAAMGSLGIGTIAKGLIAMGAALLIFAVGLTAMSGTLPGSVALLAAAAAFAVLTPSLIILGHLDWGTIVKGLAAIALTLGVLAGAGALLAGPLTALGISLLAIGASVLLVSGGIYLLAKAFSLLGEEGTKGVSVMIAAITALIALIPKMVIDFLKGIVDILKGLVTLAPQIADSLVKIIGTFLNAIQDLFPQASVLIGKLIDLIISVIAEKGPPIIEAGFNLLVKFLSGIADNIGKITENVALIITHFLEALASKAPSIVASGAKLLGQWLKGIADNIQKVIDKAADVIVKFVGGIADNLPRVYAAGVKVITNYLKSIADAVPKVIAAGVRIVVNLVEGVGRALPRVVEAAVDAIVRFIRAVGRQAPRIADAGAKAIIDFVNGMARAIRKNDDELIEAVGNLGDAIVDALVKAIGAGAKAVRDKLFDIVKSPVNAVKDFLGIGSPSKLFIEIGNNIIAGLAIGVEDQGGVVANSMEQTAKKVVDTASDLLSKVPDILGEMTDLDPVIKPVLDLSEVEKGAKDLVDMTNVTPITAAASFQQASTISGEQQTAETAQTETTGPTFIFEQNNMSPEKLSEIEIYRQTNNQLAQAKSALGLVGS